MKSTLHLLAGILLGLVTIQPCLSLPEGRSENPPGTPFDLQGYIDRELAAGKTRITIPPGRYRVTPERRSHLVLNNLRHVGIVADGVEMVCTETTRALTIRNCEHLEVSGLTIDYDPLPFTQGRITGISPDGLVHDIQLFAGYPAGGKITGDKYEIFRPDTRTLRFGSYHGCTVTQPGPGRLRVVKPGRSGKEFPEQVGDIIAIACGNAPGGNMPHAVVLNHSSEVRLVGLTLYASNCFGFLEVGCSGTVYRRCIVDRRPAEADIRERADPRIRSLNADGFHSKRAEIGPRYLECEARFQGDDCVAINGDYHMIMEARGTELRVLAKRSMDVVPGDRVQLVSVEGLRLPDARVVAVGREGVIRHAEQVFLKNLRLNDDLKNNRGGALTKAYRIIIDRPATLPRGSLVCSANRTGDGFRVIDCAFGFNRSRGILAKASKGEISGNLLEGCRGEAIKLAPEYWWLEAGGSSDVRIHRNVIKNCTDRGIVVSSHGARGLASPAGAHRNIAVTGNRIENSPAPQILATSTDGLIVRDNTIRHRATQVLTPEEAMELENCSNVDVDGNVIVGPERGAGATR